MAAVIAAVIWLALLYAAVLVNGGVRVVNPLSMFGCLLGWRPCGEGEPPRWVLLLILIGRAGHLLVLFLVFRLLCYGAWFEVVIALILLILGLGGLACRRRLKPVLYGLTETKIILCLRDGFLVFTGVVAAHGPLAGCSLADLDLRKRGLLILAVGRDGLYTHFPKGQAILAPGDHLIIYGRPDAGLSSLSPLVLDF